MWHSLCAAFLVFLLLVPYAHGMIEVFAIHRGVVEIDDDETVQSAYRDNPTYVSTAIGTVGHVGLYHHLLPSFTTMAIRDASDDSAGYPSVYAVEYRLRPSSTFEFVRSSSGATLRLAYTAVDFEDNLLVSSMSYQELPVGSRATSDNTINAYGSPSTTALISSHHRSGTTFNDDDLVACTFVDDGTVGCFSAEEGARCSLTMVKYDKSVATVTQVSAVNVSDDGSFVVPGGPHDMSRTMLHMTYLLSDLPTQVDLASVFIVASIDPANPTVFAINRFDQTDGNVNVRLFGSIVTFAEDACVVTHHGSAVLAGHATIVTVPLPRPVPLAQSTVMPISTQTAVASACNLSVSKLSFNCMVTLSLTGCVSDAGGAEWCDSVTAERAPYVSLNELVELDGTAITPFQVVVYEQCDPTFFQSATVLSSSQTMAGETSDVNPTSQTSQSMVSLAASGIGTPADSVGGVAVEAASGATPIVTIAVVVAGVVLALGCFSLLLVSRRRRRHRGVARHGHHTGNPSVVAGPGSLLDKHPPTPGSRSRSRSRSRSHHGSSLLTPHLPRSVAHPPPYADAVYDSVELPTTPPPTYDSLAGHLPTSTRVAAYGETSLVDGGAV